MKYIKRLLAFPFVLGVMFIHSMYTLFAACVNFMRYGGEMNIYNKNTNSHTIKDVYEKLTSGKYIYTVSAGTEGVTDSVKIERE